VSRLGAIALSLSLCGPLPVAALPCVSVEITSQSLLVSVADKQAPGQKLLNPCWFLWRTNKPHLLFGITAFRIKKPDSRFLFYLLSPEEADSEPRRFEVVGYR
jgi:hypothetical protein